MVTARPTRWRAIVPWIELTRPFTLLPPLLGMLSGAAAALSVQPLAPGGWGALVLGSLAACLLNAASNTLNQVEDLDLDRVDKPRRPIPRGAVSAQGARRYAIVLYLAALGAAGLVQPAGTPELLILVALTAGLTIAYSSPPLRWRRFAFVAPLVIALPRGGLLKVAGWSVVSSVMTSAEPWILGGVFFLFVLGCAPIKDFDDMKGDRLGGSSSLPLLLGPARAAALMTPFFVAPWWLLTFASYRGWLGIPWLSTAALAGVASVHGLTLAARVRRQARVGEPLGRGAWRSLYWLMMEVQVGLAVLYLAAPWLR